MGTPHAAFHSAAHLAPMCQRTLMTGCQQESSLPRKLPRAGLHGPRQGHACCAHCHPASRSGKSHSQVFPWGKESGLGSPQPPRRPREQEQGWQMCPTSFQPELRALSLLFSFAFACHLDRRGKEKGMAGFIWLPCLMWTEL